jgi:hypothetical protein
VAIQDEELPQPDGASSKGQPAFAKARPGPTFNVYPCSEPTSSLAPFMAGLSAVSLSHAGGEGLLRGGFEQQEEAARQQQESPPPQQEQQQQQQQQQPKQMKSFLPPVFKVKCLGK